MSLVSTLIKLNDVIFDKCTLIKSTMNLRDK